MILLELSGSRYGSVLYWARDYELDFEAGVVPDYSNVGLIAESFSQFLEELVDLDAR